MIPLIILIAFFTLLTMEFITHFAERSAGAYMNWRNSGREAWGTYWERESRTREAFRRLDEETAESARLKRQAEAVTSFAELLTIIPDGAGVPVTPAKFIELYRMLPAAIRNKLIPQRDIARLHWQSSWRRCTIWRSGQTASVYLIDDRNRIMRDITIDKSIIDAAMQYGKITPGRLDDIPVFNECIFPGDKFLKMFFEMNPIEQSEFFADPDVLLSLVKPVTQVGLNLIEDEDSFSSVGFESIGENGYFVVTYPAPTALINRIFRLLTWSEPDTSVIPLVDSTVYQTPLDTNRQGNTMSRSD